MKKTILIIAGLFMTLASFCQTDSAQNKIEMRKKMPPMSMLPQKPGEVKLIYELPKVTEYKIYDENGQLIEHKNGEFIDYTSYKKGTYFIFFDNKKEKFIRD